MGPRNSGRRHAAYQDSGLANGAAGRLGDARNHQNRVVESLLGIPKGTPTGTRPAGKKTPFDTLGDTLGFRKLEDVFDQRIAAALVRLGIPSAEELASLRRQVNQLIEERDKALAQAQPRRKR